MFNRQVITDQGIALENKIQAGQTTMKFTKLKTGKGIHTDYENLKEEAELIEEKQAFAFSSVKIIDENTVRLRCIIRNTDLKEGYNISEVGVYAEDPDEGEILFLIVTGVQDKMDYQPAFEEMENYSMTMDIYINIGDAKETTIKVCVEAVASAEDVAELTKELETHKSNNNNPHEVTKEQIGLDNIDNTSDIDKPVSTAQQQAIESAYTQATGYTDKTIGDLIGGAPETLDTLKEVADAIKENESVVDALDAAIGKKADQAEVDGHNRNNTIHITALERTNWNGVVTGLAAHKTSGDHDERYYTKNETNSKIAGVTNYSGQTGSHANNTWIDGNNTSIEWVVDNLPVGATRLFLYLPNDNDRNAGLLSYEWGHAKVINNGAHAEIEYTALTNNKKYCKWKCNSWNQDWLPYSAYNTPRTNGIISDVLLLSNFDGSKNNQTFLYNKNQSKNCPSGAEFGFRFVLTTADVTHNGSINAMIVLYDMNSTIYINTIQGGGWLGWRKLGSTPI